MSPDFARELARLIATKRPRMVVEFGSGVSTIIAGYALQKNGDGKLLSLDHDIYWSHDSSKLLSEHGLDDVATVLHAPLQSVMIRGKHWQWYDLTPLGDVPPIELLVVDGPPFFVQELARYPAVPLVFSQLADDAVIVLDDADRPEERRLADLWVRDYGPFDVERLETETGLAIFRRVAA